MHEIAARYCATHARMRRGVQCAAGADVTINSAQRMLGVEMDKFEFWPVVHEAIRFYVT